MKLKTIAKTILNEISNEKIKELLVDTGKLSEEDFQEIIQVSNNKTAYVTWLSLNVSKKIILPEDIYKYEEYFQIFDKYKKNMPLTSKYLDGKDYKDINSYKEKEGVNIFIRYIQKIEDKLQEFRGGEKTTGENLVSPAHIKELESVGIKFLGLVDGYQVFEIPSSVKGNENAFTKHKNILGRCKDNAKISICTIGSFSKFNYYFEAHPNSSLYVFFNLNDPLAPYQFHYESNQFMNRKDESVFNNIEDK